MTVLMLLEDGQILIILFYSCGLSREVDVELLSNSSRYTILVTAKATVVYLALFLVDDELRLPPFCAWQLHVCTDFTSSDECRRNKFTISSCRYSE